MMIIISTRALELFHEGYGLFGRILFPIRLKVIPVLRLNHFDFPLLSLGFYNTEELACYESPNITTIEWRIVFYIFLTHFLFSDVNSHYCHAAFLTNSNHGRSALSFPSRNYVLNHLSILFPDDIQNSIGLFEPILLYCSHDFTIFFDIIIFFFRVAVNRKHVTLFQVIFVSAHRNELSLRDGLF